VIFFCVSKTVLPICSAYDIQMYKIKYYTYNVENPKNVRQTKTETIKDWYISKQLQSGLEISFNYINDI
jgi:hypothetical protein